ncbi:MAG: glycosyl transferase family 90 [Pseudomonadota bacterium]
MKMYTKLINAMLLITTMHVASYSSDEAACEKENGVDSATTAGHSVHVSVAWEVVEEKSTAGHSVHVSVACEVVEEKSTATSRFITVREDYPVFNEASCSDDEIATILQRYNSMHGFDYFCVEDIDGILENDAPRSPDATDSVASHIYSREWSNAEKIISSSVRTNLSYIAGCKVNLYAELNNFIRQATHQAYKNLPFAKFTYKLAENQWSFECLYNGNSSEQRRNNGNNAQVIRTSLGNMACYTQKPFSFTRDFSIMVLLAEPGLMDTIDGADLEIGNRFAEILTRCPVLATCSSDRLPWTKNLILIPDFYILGVDVELVDELLRSTLPKFETRSNQCFFSGGLSGSDHPYQFNRKHEIPRLHLLDYADEHSFVKCVVTNLNYLKLGARENGASRNREFSKWFAANHASKIGEPIDYIGHANYKYLLSFDGFGAAWGRVPGILATGSVLLMQTECNQWFYPWMKAYDPFTTTEHVDDETHIMINKDLSNLQPVYEWLERNPKQAEQIGENGKRFAELFLNECRANRYLAEIITALETRTGLCCTR